MRILSGMNDHRIYKYPIDINLREQAILMPKGARILSVQMQHGECQAWAMVARDASRVPRRIEVIPTGGIVQDAGNASFPGTVQVDGGALVFHVFERVVVA